MKEFYLLILFSISTFLCVSLHDYLHFEPTLSLKACVHNDYLPPQRSRDVLKPSVDIYKVISHMLLSRIDNLAAIECGVDLRIVLFERNVMLNPETHSMMPPRLNCKFNNEWIMVPESITVHYIDAFTFERKSFALENKKQICLIAGLEKILR